ncbi:MAG: hypothetical protein CMI16_07235 [Opitutaceae bacterium]|nr:hypothetical protein [Opitutaceae bacterium]|tara:strand:- start:1149 stop:1901 length:753 start_codon:yes stop_codon:yes gene_type:complete
MIVLFERRVDRPSETSARLEQLRQRVVRERICQRHKGVTGGSAFGSSVLSEVSPLLCTDETHFWADVPIAAAGVACDAPHPDIASQLRECVRRYGHPDRTKRHAFAETDTAGTAQATDERRALEPIDASIVGWQEAQEVKHVRACVANVNLCALDDDDDSGDDDDDDNTERSPPPLFLYEHLPTAYLHDFAACYVSPDSAFADPVRRGYLLYLCEHATKDGFLANASQAHTTTTTTRTTTTTAAAETHRP